MTITEADWKAATARLDARESDTTVNRALLRQAAIESAELIGTTEWLHYAQHLQADLEMAKQELCALNEKLVTPMTDEQIRGLYVSANVLAERIRTLTYCLSLPKEICDHAADCGLIARLHR